MAEPRPQPIPKYEHAARQRRATQIARELGFVGRVEYHHIYMRTGGAQYGLAASAEQDLLIVSAEAFERDADPSEFSLTAVIAHERGHQLLARHERLAHNLPAQWSEASEEIVASLLGSLMVSDTKDQTDLLLKALFEATNRGMESDHATVFLVKLRGELEEML